MLLSVADCRVPIFTFTILERLVPDPVQSVFHPSPSARFRTHAWHAFEVSSVEVTDEEIIALAEPGALVRDALPHLFTFSIAEATGSISMIDQIQSRQRSTEAWLRCIPSARLVGTVELACFNTSHQFACR
jgi:hypothetical protein